MDDIDEVLADNEDVQYAARAALHNMDDLPRTPAQVVDLLFGEEGTGPRNTYPCRAADGVFDCSCMDDDDSTNRPLHFERMSTWCSHPARDLIDLTSMDDWDVNWSKAAARARRWGESWGDHVAGFGEEVAETWFYHAELVTKFAQYTYSCFMAHVQPESWPVWLYCFEESTPLENPEPIKRAPRKRTDGEDIKGQRATFVVMDEVQQYFTDTAAEVQRAAEALETLRQSWQRMRVIAIETGIIRRTDAEGE